MSNLNPGGSRGSHAPDGQGRVFGAKAIERHCKEAKIPPQDRPDNSIAKGSHNHSREVQRRLRQEAKKGMKHGSTPQD